MTHMVLLSMTILPKSKNIYADPTYAKTLVNELPPSYFYFPLKSKKEKTK